MNAVEIEAAVSDLASAPYDASEFPFQFLAAFDKKETTLKRLRKGDTNKSDVLGAVLLVNNIHLATCPAGQTRQTLQRLKASPKTAVARAKFVFATDGSFFEAEDLTGAQEPVADNLVNLANHFGFFLALAGISTVREIKDNPIDVRATGRLNKLYIELLRLNPEWGSAARRHDMNHFMARLIFCFFAEDTDIFHSRGRFTSTIEQMTESDGSNTHQVMQIIFGAMNTKIADRAANRVPAYADAFPYVNGGLFAGSTEVPRFSRIARSYLLQAGSLDWQHINPDIFGSMIQAVADDEERGALGMHYTSVPNILKVLNPLFLDDLRAQLQAAGDNGRMLLNLRQRISRIRVFDPACGSGNFLVIAYKQMRSIEAEINRRRDESLRPTEISKKNFRGIELRDFAAEIARLALVIAEYQCDVAHRGPLAAKAEFLPLDEMNWITCGNALRLDWREVCPPEGTKVKVHSDDLFQTRLEQSEIAFENEGGETYICGNPPYAGYNRQSQEQKDDLNRVLSPLTRSWRSLDYICGWFGNLALLAHEGYEGAFVTTNSVCQGEHATELWPILFRSGLNISFAVPSFNWSNNAARNAGVTVSIVGLTTRLREACTLYQGETRREVPSINQYLTGGRPVPMRFTRTPISRVASMVLGNMPKDGGNLLFSRAEMLTFRQAAPAAGKFIYGYQGSEELINGISRYCLWIEDREVAEATSISQIAERLESVARMRLASPAADTRAFAKRPHGFKQIQGRARQFAIVVPSVSSERRAYLPIGLADERTILSNRSYALYDADLWHLSLLVSRAHLVWVSTVCNRLRTDFAYSVALGWNAFPVPTLTDQNKSDLTRCAENVLLAREAHFPATIADLYDPETMPENLRAAHEANDEALERIYIGRRFRNDTERLEKLFEMYTKMTATPAAITNAPAKRTGHTKTETGKVTA